MRTNNPSAVGSSRWMSCCGRHDAATSARRKSKDGSSAATAPNPPPSHTHEHNANTPAIQRFMPRTSATLRTRTSGKLFRASWNPGLGSRSPASHAAAHRVPPAPVLVPSPAHAHVDPGIIADADAETESNPAGTDRTRVRRNCRSRSSAACPPGPSAYADSGRVPGPLRFPLSRGDATRRRGHRATRDRGGLPGTGARG